MELSEQMVELMKLGNYTYRTFSKKAKISTTYLTMLMVHNRLPTFGMLEKIAKGFSVKPSYFDIYPVLKGKVILKEVSNSVNLSGLTEKEELIIRYLVKTMKGQHDKT